MEAGAAGSATSGPGAWIKPESQGAEAHAHQQQTAHQAGAVGEPGLDRGLNCVIGNAGAQTGQAAVAHIEQDERQLRVPCGQEGHAQKAHKQQRGGDQYLHLLGHPLADLARQHAAQAEQAHHDGEIQVDLCGRPGGKILDQIDLEKGPGVHGAQRQHLDKAHRRIGGAIHFFGCIQIGFSSYNVFTV